jgi:hypothetical protein
MTYSLHFIIKYAIMISMSERQPISGRAVEWLQRRYTEQRIKANTATQLSCSEPVQFLSI